MFVKHNAPDSGQFQRRPISQGQEMTMCNMEALLSYFLEVMTNVNLFFFKLVKNEDQKIKYMYLQKISHHKEYSYEISKL